MVALVMAGPTHPLMDPPAATPVVALMLPLWLTAGAVNGTAIAIARAGDELFYLVDNAALDGPPLWVHEGEIEKCRVVPLELGGAAVRQR